MNSQHNTVFRYITLLQLIPRSPGFRATSTLQMLLDERGFNVDIRSVQRDLEKMSSHFPLLCDKSQKPYRWSFDPAFKINLPALDTPTALTLVLAEEYLKGLLPQSTTIQLSNQFNAAHKHLEQLKEKGFSDWSNRVKAIPNGKALIPAEIKSSTWSTVTEALLRGVALDVEYLSRTKQELKRFTLHPLGIVAKHSVTYLLATVDGFDDIRHFAIHRILECKESKTEYQSVPDFSIEDYLNQGHFGYKLGDHEITLEAKIRPNIAWLLSETPISEQQKLSHNDESDWVKLIAIIPDDLQTQWWIMGFGADIEVIKPLYLRERIKKLTDDMHKLYK